MKAYWLTGILGIILLAAPYVFNYAGNITAMATSILIGFGVVAASVFEATAHDNERWEYWTVGALGLAVVLAPFVLGFTALTAAMWTGIVLGGLIAIIAETRLFMRAPSN